MPTTKPGPAPLNVYVAGHRGMVGSAIVRALQTKHAAGVEGSELSALAPINLITRSHAELDLCNQAAVADFFANNPIDQVYLAAAKVGGIHANNTYPADFIFENLQIECNIIHQAWRTGVKKLLFLGSSCIYPKLATQPMRESALLTDTLEATNEPYAIAKIAGIKLCESFNRQHGTDYRCAMPTNLYGPNDNFHPQNSHVIPAMMRRFHEAKAQGAIQVTIWGTGTPMREFLHVDDMAAASVHVMNLPLASYAQHTEPMLSHINVGTGMDCTIRELAETMAKVIGFRGELVFDVSKPDGTPRKLMDVSRLNQMGWAAKTSLEQGLLSTYQWFLANMVHLRGT